MLAPQRWCQREWIDFIFIKAGLLKLFSVVDYERHVAREGEVGGYVILKKGDPSFGMGRHGLTKFM